MRKRQQLLHARNTLLLAMQGKTSIKRASPSDVDRMLVALDVLIWAMGQKNEFGRNLAKLDEAIRTGGAVAVMPAARAIDAAIESDAAWIRAHPIPRTDRRQPRRRRRGQLAASN